MEDGRNNYVQVLYQLFNRIPMQKLSWKEKYAGVLVLLIGIIYLLMQVANLSSNTSHPYAVQNGALMIDKNELFADIRTYLVIIMGLVAGWLLLKSKTAGWILGLPVLLLFTTFLLVGTLQQIIAQKGKIDQSLTIPGIGLLLLALAIIFLFLPSARQKYRASKNIVLLTLLLFVAVTGLYYFLQ
jgi:hypothetical protein